MSAREAQPANEPSLFEILMANPADKAKAIERLREALESQSAPWAVAGAYALGTVLQPRETLDVDVILPKRAALQLAKQLCQAHGYTQRIFQTHCTLTVDDEAFADLIFAGEHKLFEELLATAVVERKVPRFGVAPTLRAEAIVAAKFLAASSPYRRQRKKLMDLSDLVGVLEERREDLDMALVRRLVELCYQGAAAHLDKLIDDLDNNRPIRF